MAELKPAVVQRIAEQATAHNSGQTVFEVHDHGDYLAVRMSSWPRCREATAMAENKICTFDGCGNPYSARGYCRGHYKQHWRGKLLTALRVEMTLTERMDLHSDRNGDCWLWIAATDDDGYGYVWAGGKWRSAHRVAYELVYGTIADGMQIDHTCHVAACVRPAHLRACSQKQNQENRAGARSGTKSGVRGVSWDARDRKWAAQVGHNGQNFRLGLYATIAEAEAVVIAKRLELFTHNDADRNSPREGTQND